MNKWNASHCPLASLVLMTAPFLAAQQPEFADLVLRGGKIITVDSQDRIANAVAVTANRITAIGSDQEISRLAGPQTKVIELGGRSVLPGFLDAHSHVEGLARSERAMVPIQAPPLKNAAEIIAKLKERASQLPPGSWIVGQGTYNQVMPTREQLDRNFPDYPVVLRWSNHDWLLNHKADEKADLNPATPNPGGRGRFERAPNGEPMILRDAGIELPIPHESYEQMREWLPETLRDFYTKRGVTTVYDMSNPTTAYRIYGELREKTALPVRLVLSYIIGNDDLAEGHDGLEGALLKTGLHTGFGDDWMRIGAIKILLDGVWGTTAAVYKPVWKGSGTTWIPNNFGGVTRNQELLNKQILEAHKAGWQVWVHANGDRAQDMVLTAIEAAQKAFPRDDARHRIEHFGHFLTQDPQRTEERLSRMKRDNVIPSPQVAFLWRLTEENLKEPVVQFFPMATLIQRGFHPPGGSDTLGTQNFATNPLFSISVAVNRKTKYGQTVDPNEAISRMDAIRMFTIWAAYGGFQEQSRGSIEQGKLADMVVLSGDPLTIPAEHILDINVDYTILDGKVAYRRE
ncbi:MAG: amidohydrolase [Bryobacteraceae bacterium]